MRYFYTPAHAEGCAFGVRYACPNHLVYNQCTLYRDSTLHIGLAIIQQYYDPVRKATHWGAIVHALNRDIYLHPGFRQFFLQRAAPPKNGVYPTVTVRQCMWALRMKPLKKQPWETVFDRKNV